MCELENMCDSNDGHVSTAVNLTVTVLRGSFLNSESRRLLPLQVNDCAVTDNVGGSFRVRHGFVPSERRSHCAHHMLTQMLFFSRQLASVELHVGALIS